MHTNTTEDEKALNGSSPGWGGGTAACAGERLPLSMLNKKTLP